MLSSVAKPPPAGTQQLPAATSPATPIAPRVTGPPAVPPPSPATPVAAPPKVQPISQRLQAPPPLPPKHVSPIGPVSPTPPSRLSTTTFVKLPPETANPSLITLTGKPATPVPAPVATPTPAPVAKPLASAPPPAAPAKATPAKPATPPPLPAKKITQALSRKTGAHRIPPIKLNELSGDAPSAEESIFVVADTSAPRPNRPAGKSSRRANCPFRRRLEEPRRLRALPENFGQGHDAEARAADSSRRGGHHQPDGNSSTPAAPVAHTGNSAARSQGQGCACSGWSPLLCGRLPASRPRPSERPRGSTRRRCRRPRSSPPSRLPRLRSTSRRACLKKRPSPPRQSYPSRILPRKLPKHAACCRAASHPESPRVGPARSDPRQAVAASRRILAKAATDWLKKTTPLILSSSAPAPAPTPVAEAKPALKPPVLPKRALLKEADPRRFLPFPSRRPSSSKRKTPRKKSTPQFQPRSHL